MADTQDLYTGAIEDLIRDPDSYSTWSQEDDEATEIKSLLEENIWGDE